MQISFKNSIYVIVFTRLTLLKLKFTTSQDYEVVEFKLLRVSGIVLFHSKSRFLGSLCMGGMVFIQRRQQLEKSTFDSMSARLVLGTSTATETAYVCKSSLCCFK